MDKFMQAIKKAEELNVSTFYFYASAAVRALVLEDTENGKYRREMEIVHLRCAYSEAIMNSRDERIQMQRALSKLFDIAVWEPENFTDEMQEEANALREKIVAKKAKETAYAQAKYALKEVKA